MSDHPEGATGADTPHVKILAALAETNPRAFAAVEAAGANRRGHTNVGCVGFIDPEARLALAKACVLVYGGLDWGEDCIWRWDDPVALAMQIYEHGSWRHDMPPHLAERFLLATLAYFDAGGELKFIMHSETGQILGVAWPNVWCVNQDGSPILPHETLGTVPKEDLSDLLGKWLGGGDE